MPCRPFLCVYLRRTSMVLPLLLSALTCVSAAENWVRIFAIQGRGHVSDLAGRAITTRGVVTLMTTDGSGFWIQDQLGDKDPLTSDGIFVSTFGADPPGETLQVGDLVAVSGRVWEQRFGNALSLTLIRDLESITVLSRGNALPDPIVIPELPGEDLFEALQFWETIEGMRIRLKRAVVVGATNRFGEFVVISSRNRRRRSGYSRRSRHLFTGPRPDGRHDYNPERIIIDDESLPGAPPSLRPGDRIKNLIGVVDYRFGNYRVQPVRLGSIRRRQTRRKTRDPRSASSDEWIVTTFNVENLFDLEDHPEKLDNSSTPDPADLDIKLAKLHLAIRSELRLPEILVLQEVENTTVLETLATRLNLAEGTGYRAASLESSDPRGIENAFLWNANRVEMLHVFLLAGCDVEAAFGPDGISPGREPLVGVFRLRGYLEGRPLIIVGLHLKSRRGDEPLFGRGTRLGLPRERESEHIRGEQARVVRRYLDALLDLDPNSLIIVCGDFNDVAHAEPGEDGDGPVGIVAGNTLTNVTELERTSEQFSFVFEGNAELIDHLLVSESLRGHVVGADCLHFNASYESRLAADPRTAFRASDHDPVELRLHLSPDR